jgi:hypothetical protein
MPYQNSGGVMMKIAIKCTSRHGGKCVIQKVRGGIGFRDFHSFNLTMLAK